MTSWRQKRFSFLFLFLFSFFFFLFLFSFFFFLFSFFFFLFSFFSFFFFFFLFFFFSFFFFSFFFFLFLFLFSFLFLFFLLVRLLFLLFILCAPLYYYLHSEEQLDLWKLVLGRLLMHQLCGDHHWDSLLKDFLSSVVHTNLKHLSTAVRLSLETTANFPEAGRWISESFSTGFSSVTFRLFSSLSSPFHKIPWILCLALNNTTVFSKRNLWWISTNSCYFSLLVTWLPPLADFLSSAALTSASTNSRLFLLIARQPKT